MMIHEYLRRAQRVYAISAALAHTYLNFSTPEEAASESRSRKLNLVSAGVCVATRVKHTSAKESSWEGWALSDVGKEFLALYYV